MDISRIYKVPHKLLNFAFKVQSPKSKKVINEISVAILWTSGGSNRQAIACASYRQDISGLLRIRLNHLP